MAEKTQRIKSVAEQTDDLARGEMPLLDHLIELRTRLVWCVAWFVLAFVPCMFFICLFSWFSMFLWSSILCMGVSLFSISLS